MTMDNVGVDPNEEDERCAEYIEGGLRGEELDFEMKSRMRAVPSGAKFFDPARPISGRMISISQWSLTDSDSS